MPKNRFADVRYHVLDRCLRDKSRYYTIYDLAKKCDEAIFRIDEVNRSPITTRQIRYDLRHLESEAGYQAEIVSEKIPGQAMHYFRYADPEFTISKQPLSDQDVDHLKSALYTLQRFKGLHNDDWIGEFAARIESLPGMKPGPPPDQGEIIAFEHEDFFQGGEWMVPLYRSIDKKQPISIEYVPFGKGAEVYQVSPYLLKQYNKRWFLLCQSEGLSQVTTLPLDRITAIHPGAGVYRPFDGESPSEFFEDIIGVINHADQSVLEIILEVEKSLLPYITSKPIHGSQKPEKPTEDADWFSIALKLKPNYEFYSVLLSHGARIRIVTPEPVRAQMKSLIEAMARLYQGSDLH